MSPPEPDEGKAWRDAAFRAHRRAQLQEWAKAPFSEKLEWLEQMYETAMTIYRAGVEHRRREREARDGDR